MEERKTIYLCLAHMSDDGMEQKYVKEAFDTNWVVPMGPNVNAFAKRLEEFVNCVKMSNTSSLLTANCSLLTPPFSLLILTQLTNSSRLFSKAFTLGPIGTTQFVSNASLTYFCSQPSSDICARQR